jgi:hypothetical protein
MSEGPLVVLVGHCGPDSYGLRAAVTRAVESAQVVSCDDSRSLAEHLAQADLVLINRVLEGGFETSSGVEMIADLVAQRRGDLPRFMLISNYPEAQAAAQTAGGLPGFGKRELYSEQTQRMLRSALGHAADA